MVENFILAAHINMYIVFFQIAIWIDHLVLSNSLKFCLFHTENNPAKSARIV